MAISPGKVSGECSSPPLMKFNWILASIYLPSMPVLPNTLPNLPQSMEAYSLYSQMSGWVLMPTNNPPENQWSSCFRCFLSHPPKHSPARLELYGQWHLPAWCLTPSQVLDAIHRGAAYQAGASLAVRSTFPGPCPPNPQILCLPHQLRLMRIQQVCPQPICNMTK